MKGQLGKVCTLNCEAKVCNIAESCYILLVFEGVEDEVANQN
jgi:hypothetical protein